MLSGPFPIGTWQGRARGESESGTFELRSDQTANVRFGNNTAAGSWFYTPTLDGANLITLHLRSPAESVILLKVSQIQRNSFTAVDGEGATLDFQRK
jgi:hypothetical protein